jgi:hypothetical protein
MASKCEFSVKAKDINFLMQGSADQVVMNDLTLDADQSSKLVVLIKTDPEALLTVSIKDNT